MNPVYSFFSSIRLTVVLLALSVLLVFLATLDQVHLGIRGAQVKHFMSFFSIWQWPQQWPGGESLRWLHVPLLGGWSLGGLLIINLCCAHFRYFKRNVRSFGIGMIHGGVILLLIGQFVTDLFQVDSSMQIELGKSSNHVSRFHQHELAFSESVDAGNEAVTAISPERFPKGPIQHGALPFTVNVKWYEPNSTILRERPVGNPGEMVNQGLGAELKLGVLSKPVDNSMEGVNAPAVIIELLDSSKSLGLWLVRSGMERQVVSVGPRQFFIEVRNERQYFPYTIELKNLKHDVYEGTDIPKDFESDIVLKDPRTNLTRTFLVEMNEPLRHDGLTFYQYQMNRAANFTVFQVVENPGVILPYISCTLVTFGLTWVFALSLARFRKSKDA